MRGVGVIIGNFDQKAYNGYLSIKPFGDFNRHLCLAFYENFIKFKCE